MARMNRAMTAMGSRGMNIETLRRASRLLARAEAIDDVVEALMSVRSAEREELREASAEIFIGVNTGDGAAELSTHAPCEGAAVVILADALLAPLIAERDGIWEDLARLGINLSKRGDA